MKGARCRQLPGQSHLRTLRLTLTWVGPPRATPGSRLEATVAGWTPCQKAFGQRVLIGPGITLLVVPGCHLARESRWLLGHCADTSRPKGCRPKSTVY